MTSIFMIFIRAKFNFITHQRVIPTRVSGRWKDKRCRGGGGCYALYFMVADTGRKCYNRKRDLSYGR